MNALLGLGRSYFEQIANASGTDVIHISVALFGFLRAVAFAFHL